VIITDADSHAKQFKTVFDIKVHVEAERGHPLTQQMICIDNVIL
jgi:hypothetical protein